MEINKLLKQFGEILKIGYFREFDMNKYINLNIIV